MAISMYALRFKNLRHFSQHHRQHFTTLISLRKKAPAIKYVISTGEVRAFAFFRCISKKPKIKRRWR
jgi:hypothetical protein